MKRLLYKYFSLCLFLIFTAFFENYYAFAQISIPHSSISGNDPPTICFISDTQEPMLIERVVHKYNKNKKARQILFNKIMEISPDAVFHLGDIVAAGSNKSDWKPIDIFVSKLNENNIAFYPIPGNHEYLFSSKKGINNFSKRYPYAPVIGYSRTINNTAVILLNSNFKKLSREEFQNQLTWYRKTLNKLEADTSIVFIIVGCHHSPFTNSKVVSPSIEVQRYFLPEFFSTSKCKLFVSGHAHAFEHFKIKGKDFLVIGGGGGIQQKLYRGKKEKHQDLFDTNSETRMFHFVRIKILPKKLIVELEMLNKNLEGFDSSYKIILSE